MIGVIGSINLDLVGSVVRIPRPGETVPGGAFATAAGGKGANQALAARRAGAAVRLWGAVGNDDFAEAALALLRSDGVELTLKSMDGPTGIAMILVDAQGENVIAILPGANAAMGVAEVEAALSSLTTGDVLLLQQEIPVAATERALQLAQQRGVAAILNTAPFLAETPRLAELAPVVVANETEFALLGGDAGGSLEESMRGWSAARGQTLVVTLGAGGARAASPAGFLAAPSLPVQPVDTVGAGDTFCGYLAAALASGLGLEAALGRAAAAGSLACLRPGAQPAIPYAGELDAALSAGSR